MVRKKTDALLNTCQQRIMRSQRRKHKNRHFYTIEINVIQIVFNSYFLQIFFILHSKDSKRKTFF